MLNDRNIKIDFESYWNWYSHLYRASMLNHLLFLLDAKGYLHQNADIWQAGGENGLNLWSHKMDSKAGYVLGV